MSKDKTMHFCETIEAVTPATEELRHLLDEREIKYCDYYRSLTYFRLIPDVEDDFFTTVEETHTHRLILKVGFKSPKQAADAIQAIADTLGDIDATAARQGDAGTCEADETDLIPFVRADSDDYDVDYIHIMECSACGGTYEHVNGSYEFCPRCGARIVEVDE